jgi:hypothetical protein
LVHSALNHLRYHIFMRGRYIISDQSCVSIRAMRAACPAAAAIGSTSQDLPACLSLPLSPINSAAGFVFHALSDPVPLPEKLGHTRLQNTWLMGCARLERLARLTRLKPCRRMGPCARGNPNVGKGAAARGAKHHQLGYGVKSRNRRENFWWRQKPRKKKRKKKTS